MDISRILKWVSGGLEAFWGIPVIGGFMIIGMAWLPLPMMLALHIVTVVFSVKENKAITGNILGIITSCIGWIPVIGMIMHIISAIFILIEAGKDISREAKD
ncbi:hypothetical protein QS257_05895 [Terrilactibacillus sp. S3-3]|nr:hypothetical protein QS257_05895 [Terrilactibacillus sp. S3-3]